MPCNKVIISFQSINLLVQILLVILFPNKDMALARPWYYTGISVNVRNRNCLTYLSAFNQSVLKLTEILSHYHYLFGSGQAGIGSQHNLPGLLEVLLPSLSILSLENRQIMIRIRTNILILWLENITF